MKHASIRRGESKKTTETNQIVGMVMGGIPAYGSAAGVVFGGYHGWAKHAEPSATMKAKAKKRKKKSGNAGRGNAKINSTKFHGTHAKIGTGNTGSAYYYRHQGSKQVRVKKGRR